VSARPALLDVNVLVALLDTEHIHHLDAREWLTANIASGWASCAITQMGAVRVMSGSRYPADLSTRAALELVAAATATKHHVWWPCDIAITDPSHVDATHLLGPGQIIDSYLLALAVKHGGRFVTFDRRVSLAPVPAATAEHLVVLPG